MADNKNMPFDVLLDLLERIRRVCIDKSSPLTFDDKNFQAGYMLCLYSIVVELVDDICVSMKARKELASHILTRALLEAVVDLFNVINNPKYIDTRFQIALVERKRKLAYLQQKEPESILAAGRNAKYIEAAIQKIDNLRDTDIEKPSIRKRFLDAGMENYYDTAYSLLCDFSHHDTSALLNRPIGLSVRRLDDKSLLMLSDLVAELLLNATISIHDFLGSEQREELEELRFRWKAAYCQQAATVGLR